MPDEFYTRIALGGGVETAESCGYTLSVPYAALWQYPVQEGYAYVFSSILEVKNDSWWDGTAQGVWAYLRLRDDTGRLFLETGNAETGDINSIYTVQKLEGNRFCTRYAIRLWLEAPVEWMTLEYPSTAGWSLRVEWEEER